MKQILCMDYKHFEYNYSIALKVAIAGVPIVFALYHIGLNYGS